LARSADLQVVAEAADGHELLDLSGRARPDVLLIDYDMPHARDFTGLLRRLREIVPKASAIVLSATASAAIAESAARGRARGYVVKSTRLGAVADAIRAVAAGATWIDSNLPRPIFDAFQAVAEQGQIAEERQGNAGLGRLTRRERDVLSCVAEGR